MHCSSWESEQTWREGLLQLIGLLVVKDAEGVEVLGASHLKLDHILAPLNLHQSCIFPPCCEEEFLDLMDLLGLQTRKENKQKQKLALDQTGIGFTQKSNWCMLLLRASH